MAVLGRPYRTSEGPKLSGAAHSVTASPPQPLRPHALYGDSRPPNVRPTRRRDGLHTRASQGRVRQTRHSK